jgi:hypothetical protein
MTPSKSGCASSFGVALPVHSNAGTRTWRGHATGGQRMYSGLKSAILVFVMMGLAVGLTACAKYPVVSDTRASAPSAPAPAPTR